MKRHLTTKQSTHTLIKVQLVHYVSIQFETLISLCHKYKFISLISAGNQFVNYYTTICKTVAHGTKPGVPIISKERKKKRDLFCVLLCRIEGPRMVNQL